MKCPRCGDDLRRSKKDPTYGLCDNCRKKYKWVEEEFDDDLDDYDDDDDDDDVVIGDDDDIEESAKTRKYKSPAARPKRKRRGLKIFLIILALLIVAGIAAFIIWGGLDKVIFNKDKTSQNTSEQNDTGEQADTKPDTDITQNDSTDQYASGTYLVGTDIPAGEYVLIADMAAYFERTADPSGELDSIIANGNFSTNTTVTVSEGEYFIFSSSTAYPINKAPALDTTQQGMFKVGKDIEAGEYTIRSDGEGSYKIVSDSTHTLASLVSQEDFGGDKAVTVSDGQYLILTEAYIVQ